MSLETNLDGKTVLDTTCSLTKAWPKWASLRLDVNPEARPDIRASACYLPFPEGIFDEVYCDPPHLIREGRKRVPTDYAGGESYKRFSYWKTNDSWLKFAELVNSEFARVLKPEGRLNFKVTQGSENGSVIKGLPLMRFRNFRVQSVKRVRSVGFFARVNAQKGAKRSYTLFYSLISRKMRNPE